MSSVFKYFHFGFFNLFLAHSTLLNYETWNKLNNSGKNLNKISCIASCNSSGVFPSMQKPKKKVADETSNPKTSDRSIDRLLW